MPNIARNADPVRALLLESVHLDAVAVLSAAGGDVELLETALDEDELLRRLAGVALLGIRSKTEFSERVLDAADALLAIGAFCIGTNQIDLSAVARGIAVFNAPFSNTRSVVELPLAEIIALPGMHAGVWDKSAE